MKTIFKHFCLSLLALGSFSALVAQNVGIGTAAPAEKLHVIGNVRVSNLPGVGTRLVGSDANGTLLNVPAGTNGQVLTQTAAGPAWQSGAADDWKLLGNAGTSAATNFVGTTDAVALNLRTNNLIRQTLSLTEAVFNENSYNYDFRIESDGQNDMFFVDASANNIGINTLAPGNMVHFVSDGRTGWVTLWENTTNNGGLKQVYNTSTGNGSRVLMGVTNYSASALAASAVMGLSLNNTATGSGGIGITGAANNESGTAVEGNLFFTGGYTGWAGYFNADVYCGGTYFGSDRRLKKDIKPLTGALGLVNQFEPVTYYYDTEKFPNAGFEERLSYGFIAQDVENVIPEMVKEKNIVLNSNTEKTADPAGMEREVEQFKVVNYSTMIPILTQAIKEQQAIIESQNQRINELEQKVNNLGN